MCFTEMKQEKTLSIKRSEISHLSQSKGGEERIVCLLEVLEQHSLEQSTILAAEIYKYT